MKKNINGIKIFKSDLKKDSRGFFKEVYKKEKLKNKELIFHCLSYSKKNVLRGLHIQTKKPQAKYLTVIKGKIFDVAVDLRKDSATFGKWVGELLSAENHKQLWIPPGLAHGFLVLSETAEFLYKTTDYYDPQSEVCLSWSDPSIKIDWPIPLGKQTLLNAKDAAGLSWDQAPKL